MNLLRISIFVCVLALLSGPVTAGNGEEAERGFAQGRSLLSPGRVLPLRARVEPINRMLEQKLDDVLPHLMRETGIDMWLVINREYAEDPVYMTLVPEPVFAARRTTMLLFFDRGEEAGVERLTVSRYPFSSLYEPAWEGGDLDEQWRGLAEAIASRDPQVIGIDVSRHWPVADGLTASLRDRLEEVLDEKYVQRLRSAEELAVRWLETRTQEELEVYPGIVALARSVISEAFSDRVIVPGITSTEDVKWYIAERFSQLQLPIWFIPDVNLQRAGEECRAEDDFCGVSGTIKRGDVLHTDVGICYLRLCTDTQEMGYVLNPGEDEVPEDLRRALAVGNRWQDLLTGEFVAGRTGNEVLAATLRVLTTEEIEGSVYTHPLGYFGHAPGPTIGMWDNQGDTPVQGDWRLHPSTAYAIEGNVKVAVPGWDGQMVQIKLEQSAVFDGDAVQYLAGRQTEWHVVR
jgi:hypothetical protein